MTSYGLQCPTCNKIVCTFTHKPEYGEQITSNLVVGASYKSRYPKCVCGYQLENNDFCSKHVVEVTNEHE